MFVYRDKSVSLRVFLLEGLALRILAPDLCVPFVQSAAAPSTSADTARGGLAEAATRLMFVPPRSSGHKAAPKHRSAAKRAVPAKRRRTVSRVVVVEDDEEGGGGVSAAMPG